MPSTPENTGTKRTPRARFIPLLTAIAAFGVYLLTLSPEVGAGDGAELTLQATQLGVTHPPGYPVYILLGKLFTLLIADPAQATNLLSAAATAFAAGLLCAMALTLTADATAAILASLLFAFVPTIWAGAVTTEVYNVNVCLVALVVWLLLRAQDRGRAWPVVAAGAVFGLSLGTGLANVLLLPGLGWLVWCGSRRSALRLPWFLLLVAVIGAAGIAWTMWRSQRVPPLGTTYVSDTLQNLARYLGGRQYLPTELPPLGFFVSRFLEHGAYWLASFLWLGVAVGLLGIWAQWRQRRRHCVGLTLMFLANMGYFTFYTWQDYRAMVAPSYLVFAVWIAFGIRALTRLASRFEAPALPGVVVAALLGGLLLSGFRSYRREGNATPVTDFVRTSFEIMPADALVVAEWAAFTPMLYFQRVHHVRPDVTLIERAEAPRYYRWGDVDDWRQYALDASSQRPVVIDVKDEALADWTEIEPFAPPRWHRLR